MPNQEINKSRQNYQQLQGMQIDQTQKQVDKYLQTRSDYIASPFNPTLGKLAGKKKKNRISRRMNATNCSLNYLVAGNECDRGYKFRREKRFKTVESEYRDFCSIEIPAAKSKISCSFGYGQRQPISKIILKRSQISPSPDKYQIRSANSTRGVSFTSCRESQLHRYTPHRQDPYSPHFTQDNPGFIYNIRDKIRAKPFTFSKKLKMYSQRMADLYAHVPGPQYCVDGRKLSNIGGVDRGASFKTGEKMDLAKPLNQNPGPQYSIGGFCDKFKNLRLKSAKKQSRSQKKSKKKQTTY